jgi:hypothetical protein
MDAFDAEVAEIRERVCNPRQFHGRKADATPEQWAANLDYAKSIRRPRTAEEKVAVSKYHREYYQKNRDRVIARTKQYAESNPERRRHQSKKRRIWAEYYLTLEQHAAMLAGCRGVCSICGSPPTSGEPLHVDHAHDSGFVRGLACRGCNHGLGNFRDDPALLRKAAEYLASDGDRSFCMVTYARLMEERHDNN